MAIPRSEYLSNVWKDGIFDNKVVFCTGGAGSICSAQVRAMVHLGANACIIGRNTPKTEAMAKNIQTARTGSKVIGIGNVDVRNINSLESAVETCVRELGGIDFVIAGAAGNFLSPFSTLSPNAFRTVLEIDTLGSFNTLKATLPPLLKSASLHPNTPTNPSTGGRILFISATFHFTGMPLQGHVAAAKAGVDAISATTALEYGPRGITSNVISPGPIQGTEGMERLGDKGLERKGEPQKRNPIGRFGTVKEVADGTVYLFSDAGSFVNGEVLVIDGGNWRMSGNMAGEMKYPDYLLDEVSFDRRKKDSKL